MHQRSNRIQSRQLPSSLPGPRCLSICVCLLVLACIKSQLGYGQSAVQAPTTQPQPSHTVLRPEANRLPDANGIMAMREKQAKKLNFDVANAERKRQLTEDSALLLKLAAELKLEIENTPKDVLTLSVIRKAEDIERLARNVQQKMKLTVGAATN